jgi:probable poly-beta-1,6-N-acetyl-D-glucosamine export protein
LKFVVPAFIMISGFALMGSKGLERSGVIKFYIKRLKSLVAPYIAWNAVYLLYFIYQHNMSFSYSQVTSGLVYGSLVYHMYFMVISIQFSILFPVLKTLYKKYEPKNLTVLFVAINLLSYAKVTGEHTAVYFSNYIGFFAVGIYFSITYREAMLFLTKKRVWVFTAGLILTLYYGTYAYFIQHSGKLIYLGDKIWVVFSMVSTFMCILLSSKILESGGIAKTYLKDISRESFAIYLSHPLILFFMDRFYGPNFSVVMKIFINSASLIFIYSAYVYGKKLITEKRDIVSLKRYGVR